VRIIGLFRLLKHLDVLLPLRRDNKATAPVLAQQPVQDTRITRVATVEDFENRPTLRGLEVLLPEKLLVVEGETQERDWTTAISAEYLIPALRSWGANETGRHRQLRVREDRRTLVKSQL
jgi:hypothetical protein